MQNPQQMGAQQPSPQQQSGQTKVGSAQQQAQAAKPAQQTAPVNFTDWASI